MSFLINRLTKVKVMQTTTSSELPASGFRNRYLKAKNKQFSQGRHRLTRLAHSSIWQPKSIKKTPLSGHGRSEQTRKGEIYHRCPCSKPFFSLDLQLVGVHVHILIPHPFLTNKSVVGRTVVLSNLRFL